MAMVGLVEAGMVVVLGNHVGRSHVVLVTCREMSEHLTSAR